MTAVEWYKNELNSIELTYLNKVIDRKVYMDLKSEAFEQAKEMEKEQMIDFYVKGAEDWYDGFYKVDSAEQHYNKNFKSE